MAHIDLKVILESDYLSWFKDHQRYVRPPAMPPPTIESCTAQFYDVGEMIERNSLPPHLEYSFEENTRSVDAQKVIARDLRQRFPALFPRRQRFIGRFMPRYGLEFDAPTAMDFKYQPRRALHELGLGSGDIIIATRRALPQATIVFSGGMLRDLQAEIQNGNIGDFMDGVITDERKSWRLDRWYINKNKPRPSTPIGGLILYTEEDEQIARYVREHYGALHVMSGLYIMFYCFEYAPPPRGDLRAGVRSFWAMRLPAATLAMWRLLKLATSKPYPSAEIYELANELAITPDQIPCIVIFDKWDMIKSNRIILKVRGPIHEFFRRACTDIMNAVERASQGEKGTSLLKSFTLERFREQLPAWWGDGIMVNDDAAAARIKILFLAADPSDLSQLRSDRESRDIREQLQLSQYSLRFEFQQRMAVRPRDLSLAMLQICPSIVHFSGHGMRGAIFLEDDIGQSNAISLGALASLFGQFAPNLKCVILNACYSKNQASVIARHVDYVIGMSGAVSDAGAIAFSVGFYQALGAGRSIEEAYRLGWEQMKMLGVPESLKPSLITPLSR